MKRFKQIVGTILVSLCASFLWETIFSPITARLVRDLLAFLRIGSLQNHFYTAVANVQPGFGMYSGLRGSSLIIVFMVTFAYFDKSLRQLFRIRIVRILSFCIVLFSMVYYFSITNTSAALHRGINIAAPYISESERLQMISDVYLIRSSSDYDQIVNELNQIFQENELDYSVE